MRILKLAVPSLLAVLFLGACASNGPYEDDRSRDRERPSAHRH